MHGLGAPFHKLRGEGRPASQHPYGFWRSQKQKPQPFRVGVSFDLVVEKVIVSPNDLEVRLHTNGIERLVQELRPEPVEQTEEALA